MIIDLPKFTFEIPSDNEIAIDSLFDKIRDFLDAKGVSKNEYVIGSQSAAGFGELVLQEENNFWLIYTTERGANFDVSIFSNKFHAVNYFIFRLTGKKDTIYWPSN